jgi:hypothetical protein
LSPRQTRPKRSAIEPVVPESTGAAIELPKTQKVHREPVVLVVAPELGIEGFLLLFHPRIRCFWQHRPTAVRPRLSRFVVKHVWDWNLLTVALAFAPYQDGANGMVLPEG